MIYESAIIAPPLVFYSFQEQRSIVSLVCQFHSVALLSRDQKGMCCKSAQHFSLGESGINQW